MCSQQSATAEFTTDDEILAALRPTEVRTDRPEFTTDDEILAALKRNELALNSASATLDREKQAELRTAWLKSSGTSSWYDAGVRLIAERPARQPVKVELENSPGPRSARSRVAGVDRLAGAASADSSGVVGTFKPGFFSSQFEAASESRRQSFCGCKAAAVRWPSALPTAVFP